MASAPQYGLFSNLTSHAIFWGDLADLSPELMAHYKRWFAWVKTQRAHSDFYRWYQVSNIFPAPDGVSSRDYRHAIPAARYGITPMGIHAPAFDPVSDHPGGFWDGVARLDERGEGPIFLFRPDGCVTAFFQLRIPWIERNARYRVEDVTESRELGTFGGDELIERGIEVYIPEAASAKVIVMIMLVSNNRKIMRDKTNGPVSNTLGWLTTICMTIAAIALLLTLGK